MILIFQKHKIIQLASIYIALNWNILEKMYFKFQNKITFRVILRFNKALECNCSKLLKKK